MTLRSKIAALCGAAALLTALHYDTKAAQAAMNKPATIAFVSFQDPWTAALERWWDISNDSHKQFNDWLTGGTPNGKFRYDVNPQVTLTYDQAPSVPYFVGHIDATGLKPNFAYQLKLVGKPVYGSRGAGTETSYVDLVGVKHAVSGTAVNGDDWANERIGYAGRWWDETNQTGGTNNADYIYTDNYKTPVTNKNFAAVHTVYGYHFMGSFVTDSQGEVHVDFTGRYSYHIDWASWQGGLRDRVHGTFPVNGWLTDSSPTTYYGYGSNAPSTSVTLYYEYEHARGDGVPVNLPTGNYHCRFFLTEESFHNNLGGGTNSALGGFWKTVLATEDFDATGQPDTNPANDVVFAIDAPPTITDFSPGGGAPGTSVSIVGYQFKDATAVTFNGASAAFTVLHGQRITATVPSGATTGPIRVIGPTGKGTSPRAFKVVPTITGFAPASGPVGTVVTIQGKAFTGATAVRFNGQTATFHVDSAKQITATVPAGATDGPIRVATAGGPTDSATSFDVTP